MTVDLINGTAPSLLWRRISCKGLCQQHHHQPCEYPYPFVHYRHCKIIKRKREESCCSSCSDLRPRFQGQSVRCNIEESSHSHLIWLRDLHKWRDFAINPQLHFCHLVQHFPLIETQGTLLQCGRRYYNLISWLIFHLMQHVILVKNHWIGWFLLTHLSATWLTPLPGCRDWVLRPRISL